MFCIFPCSAPRRGANIAPALISDLLAAFDQGCDLSLLDVVRIERQLANLLGQPVDLVEEGTLKPRLQKSVEAEAVRAF